MDPTDNSVDSRHPKAVPFAISNKRTLSGSLDSKSIGVCSFFWGGEIIYFNFFQPKEALETVFSLVKTARQNWDSQKLSLEETKVSLFDTFLSYF